MTPLPTPLRGRAWNEPEQAATRRAAVPHAQVSPSHPVVSLSILGVWLWGCVCPIVGKTECLHCACNASALRALVRGRAGGGEGGVVTPLHIPLRGQAWNEPEQAAARLAAAPHA